MSATITAPVEVAKRTEERPSWGALLVLLAGTFISTLDVFIVNVAIPATQTELQASTAAIQWIVAGFGLALAAGLITGGRLGDLYGRRKMYALGLGLFTAASAACALATTPEFLITGRIAQGLAAALLMPQVLGIISIVYTGARRARAFTAYGLAMGFAGVFGQLIGGAIIEADLFGLGWRSVYWVNVPIGVVALLFVGRTVPESKGEGRVRLDLTGTLLAGGGLVAVVLPLVQGREQGWPLWTWLSLGGAVVLLAVFVLHQRGHRAPLMDPAMFRERSFSVGSALSLVYSLSVASFFLILALYLQQGQGMSALNSGLLFTALGAPYLIAAGASEKLAVRLGRQVLTLGVVVQGAGFLVLAETVYGIGATGSVGLLLPGLVLVGAGMGFAMPPMAAVVLSGVSPSRAGSASGVLSTAQQVGGALGVALVGIVFYDALGDTPAANDVAHAFTWGLIPAAVFCAAAAVLVQFLPKKQAGQQS